MDDRVVQGGLDEEWIGKICPYCQTALRAGSAVEVCPACKTCHHEECWEANRGCAVYGCACANILGPAVPQPLSFWGPWDGAVPVVDANPWAQRQIVIGFWHAYFKSVWMVLIKPRNFYFSMPVQGRISSPMQFAVVTGGIVALIYAIWQSVLVKVPFGFLLAVSVFPGAFAGFIGPLVWAGLRHLCLMIVGGDRSGFKATYFVGAFASAVYLVAPIPYVGIVAAPIWEIAVVSVGLSIAHRVSLGKAVAAALLAFPLSFLGGLLILALLAPASF